MRMSDPKSSGRTFSKAARAVWVRLPWHQVTVGIPHTPKDKHAHIVVTIGRGTQSVSIDLSALTVPELAAFKFAMLVATEIAEPIVAALDEKARTDFEQRDDDSDDRVYRGLPTVAVRRGAFPVSEHNQSVLQRYQESLQGLGGQLLPGGGSAYSRGSVAHSVDEGQDRPDDDSSQAGEHLSVEGILGL